MVYGQEGLEGIKFTTSISVTLEEWEDYKLKDKMASCFEGTGDVEVIKGSNWIERLMDAIREDEEERRIKIVGVHVMINMLTDGSIARADLAQMRNSH